MIELQRVLDLLENPDRILITRRGEKICYGYKANICGAHGSRSHLPDYGLTGHEIVHKIRPHIEYRHPKWQEKGLDAPLDAAGDAGLHFQGSAGNILFRNPDIKMGTAFADAAPGENT